MWLLLLCAVFAVSGASALIFETLWFFQAGLGFGNSVWAASLVLSGFMAGLALGGWLAARWADRLADKLRTYAGLELGIAVSGVLLTQLLPSAQLALAPLAAALAAQPVALNALRLLSAFALLLIPATAIGLTLPLLTSAVGRQDARFARVLALLYGVNTLGAVVGTVATELWLLPSLGVHGTAWLAGGLNLCAASGALALSRRVAAEGGAALPSVAHSHTASSRAWPWLSAAWLSGFCLLALEVVWLRVLTLFLNDTPLAFAMVLALVLAGVAVGSLATSAWAVRCVRPEAAAPGIAASAGLLGLSGYVLYPLCLQRFMSPNQSAATIVLVALPLVLPTCLASGALYPLLGAGLRRCAPSDATTAGRLSFANTLGAGCGSLAAGFGLLPHLGMERSLFALFLLYGVIGWSCAAAAGQSARVRAGSLVVFGACLALFPFGFMREQYVRASVGRWMRPGDQLAHIREGQTATIVHVVHRLNGAALFDQVTTNAYSMTVNGFFGRRYMKLFAYLPTALHPQLRRGLVLGYGIGSTAEALTENPDLEQIDVVDISRDLLDVSRETQTRLGPHPLDDPRVRVHIEDGRFFLAATSARYDLITGEPPPPIMAGVVNLYTREYFALVRSRLAPGGMTSYWLPTMNISVGTTQSIIAAFCSAFADCSLWHGAGRNFVLMGTRDANGPVSEQQFTRAWRDPRRSNELRALGLELPSQLGALFIGDASFLAEQAHGAQPLEDNWPKRMQQPGNAAEQEARIATWRNTDAAQARFAGSPFIRKLWPNELRQPTLAQFENQRLLDDLLSPVIVWARGIKVLHQVLRGTHLTLPVLLLLNSDPDIQRALARLPSGERERAEWLPHRIAGRLSMRDFPGALELLDRTPPHQLPLPELRGYVAYAIERLAQPH